MNISITFRHMDTSESVKAYAREKVAKLQKFLRQPMTAKVTLSLDRLKHVAETRVSSGGAHLEAKEASEDMYVSIDRVLAKLERQIRGTKGAAQSKKRRSGDSLRSGSLSAAKKKTAAPKKKVVKKKKAVAKTRAR
ncbi:MAG: ribosome-associated translation inhibitor RaiA [Polyangiaceae bacterium]